MIPELDEKQHRHMLAVLSENVGYDSATELVKMIGIFVTKGKHEIKDVPIDLRAHSNPSKQGRARAFGAGGKPAQKVQPGINIAFNLYWTITSLVILRAL